MRKRLALQQLAVTASEQLSLDVSSFSLKKKIIILFLREEYLMSSGLPKILTGDSD